MRKILLFLVFISALLSFNFSFAAICPPGYTETNITSPSNGSDIWTPEPLNGYYFTQFDFKHVGHYLGYVGPTCYKEGSLSSGTATIYRYVFDGVKWYRTGQNITANQTYGNAPKYYEFMKTNFIPEINSLSLSGNIVNTDLSSVPLNISSIYDTSTGQTLSYKYSWDGVNFSVLTGATLNTPINSGSQFKIDARGRFGTGNTLHVKLHDGFIDSNVLTLKIETGEIFIDESKMFIGGDKNVKAKTNGGDLFYAFTDNVCTEELTFTPYQQEVLLNNTSFNNKKVCFKSVLNGVSTFKTTSTIQGIGAKTTGVKKSNLFDDYLNWRKGELLDFDPLYILITSQVSNSIQGASVTRNYPKLLTDVNGDGLPDLILTNYISQQRWFYPSSGAAWSYNEDQYYYALLLNKGNMDYEVKYRCVYIKNDTTGATGYYGDCAQ